MNRQMRREQGRKNGKSYSLVDLPPIMDSFTIFNGVESILLAIRDDGIMCDQEGDFVFLNNKGQYEEIIPVLLGWVETWERVALYACPKYKEQIEMKAIHEVNKLLYSKQITPKPLIEHAIKDFETLRSFYNSLTMSQRKIIKSIAIEYERIQFIKQNITPVLLKQKGIKNV